MSRRIRSIKPEILEDEATAGLTSDAWRVFVSMFVIADDHGNLRADPDWLACQIFWKSKPSRDIRESLATLSEKLVLFYSVGGQRYASIRNWKKHQRVDHPGKPAVPGPELGFPETLATLSRDSRENLARPTETLATDLDLDLDLDRIGPGVGGEHEGGSLRAPPPSASPPVTDGTMATQDRPENEPTTGTRHIAPSESTSPPPKSTSRKSGKDTRAQRLPEGWSPPEDVVDALRAEFGGDPLTCLPRFRDYWAGVPGQRGTKLDWPATFRNWVRTEASRGTFGGARPGSSPARTAHGVPIVQQMPSVPFRGATLEESRRNAQWIEEWKAKMKANPDDPFGFQLTPEEEAEYATKAVKQ